MPTTTLIATLRLPEGEAPPEDIFESLQNLWRDFLGILPNLGVALALLVLTWLAAKLVSLIVRKALSRLRLRSSLQDLFHQLTYTLVWVFGILAASVVAFPGVTVGKILTVLGLGSIAVGFAFKDIFENFFAGVLILWRFPFEAGDFIQIGDLYGQVEHTTIRMTAIRQTDGQLVVLPNAHLFKNPVHVVTNRELRRTTVICGVAYDEDVNAAREVIKNAIEACERVSGEHEVQVFAREFGASSVDFELAWWTGSEPIDERRCRDEVVAAVKGALDEAEIEIPYPYRTLTFKEPLHTRTNTE